MTALEKQKNLVSNIDFYEIQYFNIERVRLNVA